jgi:hypothetical protein
MPTAASPTPDDGYIDFSYIGLLFKNIALWNGYWQLYGSLISIVSLSPHNYYAPQLV